MTETKAVKSIASLKRRTLSVNGNPRFDVCFTDGTRAQTETDASFNYEIENSEYRAPAQIEITFTRSGKIAYGRVI